MLSNFSYLKDECKTCKGRGYLFDNKRAFRGEEETNYAKQCTCIKKMVLYSKLADANVPREYFDKSMDDFKENSGEKVTVKKKINGIIENIDMYAREGKGLFLYGGPGTGKTMLSIEILKQAVKRGYSVHYDFYPMIFNDFTKSGYVSDEVKAKYNKIFEKTDFLVLDELAKERDYFNAKQGMSDDMSKRFLEMNILKRRASKPTILISNLNNGLDDIGDLYGTYVHSMMTHTYETLAFTDDDFRKG